MTKTGRITDARLFELIGEVDPLTADDAPTDVDTEAALRTLLASGPPVDFQPAAHRLGSRYPRRMVLRAGVGVTAAGAIAFGVVNVLPNGEPGYVDTASAHAVIRHALDAITPTANSILHMDLVGSQTNPNGTTDTWQDDSWQQDTAPYNRRTVQTGPQGQAVETATINGTAQLYDQATNTVYEDLPPTPLQYDIQPGSTPGTYELTVPPPKIADVSGTSQQQTNVKKAKNVFPTTPTTITITSAQAQALKDGTDQVQWNIQSGSPEPATLSVGPVDSTLGRLDGQTFRAQALALMRSPGVQVDTQASIDGTPAIKITAATPQGHQVYYIAPGTYQPIELDSFGEGGSVTLRFPTYQELTGPQATAVQLSLTAEHPTATVDQNPADYQAAENRLNPQGER